MVETFHNTEFFIFLARSKLDYRNKIFSLNVCKD